MWRVYTSTCWTFKSPLWAATGTEEERKDMFYLTTLSIHFIYGYMAMDIWQKGLLRYLQRKSSAAITRATPSN